MKSNLYLRSIKYAVDMVMNTAENFKIAGKCNHMLKYLKRLMVHQVTIKGGRRITTDIYSRTMLITMLKKSKYGRNLTRRIMTRFVTTNLVIVCISDLKASLRSMFRSRSNE